jgi:LysR family glycine cleavage system transcriptional activator
MLKTMADRLPSLNSLRAFEAAARHLSFKKSAQELNVTPAAIGHQIKGLEDHLGIQLFRRLNRALLLTEAGQACLPELREGFDKLSNAVETLRRQAPQSVLTGRRRPGNPVRRRQLSGPSRRQAYGRRTGTGV